MPHPVRGVDHCFVLVDDLDKAATAYSALGFTLSPRGLHSEAKGSANYTIMFPDDYFELLGLLTETPLNAGRRQALAEHGQGLHAVACRIGTAEEAQSALAALGIKTHGLGSFERPVPLPGGGTTVAAFSTLVFEDSEVPMGSVFMCQHKTPETVWLPELLNHPNTACGLHAILAVSEDPESDAGRYTRLWADGKVHSAAGVSTVTTGPNSAPLVLMPQEVLESRYAGLDISQSASGVFSGLQIKVSDLEATRKCLTDAGVDMIETQVGLAVGPADTAGVILEFVNK